MSDSTAVQTGSWLDLRDRVNSELSNYLQPTPDCPEKLREAMSYSLLAGGKRIRPILTLLACEACGGTIESALPAACAVEMIHTYSLIHDDLPAMDDDDVRRGRPTNHIVFGEASAILAGDGLLTLAFEVIARDVKPGNVAAACCADLANAAGITGMVGGQVADLEAEGSDSTGLAELEAVHRRKTGRLLCSALTIGGRIAGGDSRILSTLARFGQCVGLAFQIADDVLDVTGDNVKMGKEVRKDADHGKQTYPAILGIEASRKKAQDLIDEACESIEFLGSRGRRLEQLARFVLERDH